MVSHAANDFSRVVSEVSHGVNDFSHGVSDVSRVVNDSSHTVSEVSRVVSDVSHGRKQASLAESWMFGVAIIMPGRRQQVLQKIMHLAWHSFL